MLPDGLLESWLGVSGSDVAVVTDAAERALVWIETQTGRYFHTPRDFKVTTHGGRRTYWLPEIPNHVDGESDDVYLLEVERKNAAGEWETVPEEDYEVVPPDMGRLYEMPTVEFEETCWTDTWPRARNNLRFRFTAGYAEGALPGDVQQLVLDMVGAWWRDRRNQGLQSETIGGYSYEKWMGTDGQRFADDWTASLTKWKHPVLGRS